MYCAHISIRGIESAKAFVAMTAQFPGIRITLNHNEYSIDAHSIIGILSLDLSKPIDLEAESDDNEEMNRFIEALKPFTV